MHHFLDYLALPNALELSQILATPPLINVTVIGLQEISKTV